MVDVSSANHTDGREIDWHRVHGAGFGAVMVKATEGIDYVNPWLTSDAMGAHDAGLLVGYYHFRRPGLKAASREADWALAAIKGLPRQLGLAQDLEVTEGCSWAVLAEQAREFHAQAKTVVEHSPVYLDRYFLDNLPGAPWDWWVWIAQTDRPRRDVWAWQETTPRAVRGIVGPVDVGWLRPNA
jgi:GH25 family lysozyme M1 (1,4-beta-N-acetylmuramidase)